MNHSSAARGMRLVVQTLLLTTVAGAATSASAQTQSLASGYPVIATPPAAPPVPVTSPPNQVVSGRDGGVWFTLSGSVGRANPQGQITQTLTTQGTPTALTAGPSGDLQSIWFIESVASSDEGPAIWWVGRISTDQSVGCPASGAATCLWEAQINTTGTTAPVPVNAPTPNAIANAVGSQQIDNGIYITDTSNNILWRVNPTIVNPGSSNINWIEIATNFPTFGVAFGPDNNLWCTEYGSINDSGQQGYIAQIPYPTTANPIPAATLFLLTTNTEPSGGTSDAITAGPDLSSVWFSQNQGAIINSISTNATAANYTIASPYTFPGGYFLNDMALGPDFAIWFTQGFLPTVSSPPSLGRIAVNNGVASAPTFYNVNANGAAFVQPYGLAVGPNNNDLWFTDPSGELLGDAVVIPRLVITPVALPNAVIGQPYQTNLVAGTASGGTPPYQNWRVATGFSLPAGLTLNASTGVISGTPSGPLPGTTTFNVTVNDTNPPFDQLSAAQPFSITVVAGAPAGITPTSGGGQSAQVNSAFSNPLVATVTDANGNPVSGANVTFTAPASGASGTFPGNVTTATVQTNASGVASTGFTANTIAGGPYGVTASVNSLSASFGLTNTAGSPASITATSGGGQSAQVNSAFSNPLVATVKDAYGNLVSGANVTFTAPASGASGTFPGNATVQTNASGVATSPVFSANTISGSYGVTASVNSLSASFGLTNTAGSPASITATSGGGQSAQANSAFSNPLVATVKDAYGNLVSGANVTFTAPASGASGTFPGSVTMATVQTNASGVASTGFTANTIAGGPYGVTASVNGLSTSFGLTNTAGSPASITATSGGGQSAQVNSAFSNPLVATVKDAYGNLVSGANVTFTAPASGAGATFAGNATVQTNASGVATSPPFSANTVSGPYGVTASVNSLSASFALTNIPGPPASVTATFGGGQSAQVNHAFTNPLVATVKDTYGNPVSGVNVTFSAPASGASGTFAGSGITATAQTNASGVATSPAFTANVTAGGPYTVSASVNGLSGSASFSLTNTAGSPATITATSGGGQSAQVGHAFLNALVATVTDANNNPISGVNVTFTAPATGASGTFAGSGTVATVQTNASGVATSPTFTADKTAGPYSVTSSVNGLSTTFALTNTPGPPGSITATSGGGQTAQVKQAFGKPLVATVMDANNNPVSGASVTFSSPTSGASGTFAGGGITATVQTNASGVATSPTFTANATAGGPYTVTASATDVSSPASFALTNNAGAPGSITATSGGGQSAQVNQLFADKLVATVTDANGNPVPAASVTFTAPASGASGTFAGGATTASVKTSSSGVATSPAFTANATAGAYSVTASVTGVTSSASFALTNTGGAPASVTATSGGGQSAQVSHAFGSPLVATVKDASGNLVSGASVTFTAPASGPSGTFAGSTTATVKTNASGVATSPAFTANAVAGSYTVAAKVTGVTSSASFALINTPSVTFTLSGVPTTQTPGTNVTNATITLTPASSIALAGTLSVALSTTAAGFPADNNGDAGFGTGFGAKPATASIPVPAGSTSVPFPSLDPGTVAGNLTVTFTVAGQTPTSSTLTIEPLAPIIEANSVQITDVTSTGFDVELVATSTTLDLKTATFTFTAATGAQISGNSTFTADVSTLLPTWFATASNYQYGGAFSLSIPFTISGPASAIQSVSVTLTNSVGTSPAVSGTQ